MYRIRSNELNLFAQELRACLSPAVLQEIAQRVGFVKRKSKYQSNELIALCFWMSHEVGSTSLPQLCSRLEASTGVSMSAAEGLNQRFNQTAVAYLREVFRMLLAQKLCANQSLPDTLLSRFRRIRILDATVFDILGIVYETTIKPRQAA